MKVGLVAGDGGAVIWPLVLGPALAKEYLLTGKPLLAEDAARLGLVNHVVAAGELAETALDLARQIAAKCGAALVHGRSPRHVDVRARVRRGLANSRRRTISSMTEDLPAPPVPVMPRIRLASEPMLFSISARKF